MNGVWSTAYALSKQILWIETVAAVNDQTITTVQLAPNTPEHKNSERVEERKSKRNESQAWTFRSKWKKEFIYNEVMTDRKSRKQFQQATDNPDLLHPKATHFSLIHARYVQAKLISKMCSYSY